ncbi:MAG TPA: nuclear transport factor 2 family protein [Gemmatimonadales bacterium]|nr:nuclear transport factor 2 family protein [Gemmatimonadales bacterium]
MSVRTFTAPPVLALALLQAGCGSQPLDDLVPVFTAQFDRAAADWNRGDLDGFMADYAGDSLTGFVSGGRVERGYAWIRAHYAPRFREGAQRDSLRFENVQARQLGRDFALVTARYVLARDGATVSSGPFTLVMQRGAEGWKIVHDHTSSDPR